MKDENKEQTYEIRILCRNCGFDGRDFKPKGTLIYPVPDSRECPKCGCETLRELKLNELN